MAKELVIQMTSNEVLGKGPCEDFGSCNDLNNFGHTAAGMMNIDPRTREGAERLNTIRSAQDAISNICKLSGRCVLEQFREGVQL